MKFKIIILLLIISCTPQLNTLSQKNPYTAKGFVYLYNERDYKEKIIKGKLNNDLVQISHQGLKVGTLIKIINPKNKKSIVLKNLKRVKYPDFYKILITAPVMNKLDLNNDLPIVEIIEIKKNKSFIAEKAKVYQEEKKIPSNAPVTSVKISNISKNKSNLIDAKLDIIFIHIATFYSIDTAKFLKQRILKDVPNFDNNKLKIKKINNKETQVVSGPYTSVNLLKNDYIKLKKFGFEELDIFINE